MNYDATKLTDFFKMKIFIMATICKWDSLRKIGIGIRSKKEFQKEIVVDSISYSPLLARLTKTNSSKKKKKEHNNELYNPKKEARSP